MSDGPCRRVLVRCARFLALAVVALSCSTSVLAPGNVINVMISPTADTVRVGSSATFAATVVGPDGSVLVGPKVFWNSDNPDVVTVSDQGVASGVAPGTGHISASVEGKSAIAAVTVLPKGVASVDVSPSQSTITVGRTVQLQATPLDEDGHPLSGHTVTWSSADGGIATVNGSGLVTGTGAGTVTITATSDGKHGTASVTVQTPPAVSMRLSPAAAIIRVGQMAQLTATAFDASGAVIRGAPVTWSSSAPSVANVSSTGLVTGAAPGFADITAVSGSAHATAQIAVTPADADRARADAARGATTTLHPTTGDRR